jgi:hypothetical protein
MKDRHESKVPQPAKPDPGNKLGRGAPFDREERIGQRAHCGTLYVISRSLIVSMSRRTR